jgi:hypothetical protein
VEELLGYIFLGLWLIHMNYFDIIFNGFVDLITCKRIIPITHKVDEASSQNV